MKIVLEKEYADHQVTDICLKELAKKYFSDPKREGRLTEELRIIEDSESLGVAFYTTAALVSAIKRHYGAKHNLRGGAGSCLVSYLLGISSIDPVMDDYEIPYEEFLTSTAHSISFDINIDHPEFQLINRTLAEILPISTVNRRELRLRENFRPDESHKRADVVFEICEGNDCSELCVAVEKSDDKTVYLVSNNGIAPQRKIEFTIHLYRNENIDLLNELLNLSSGAHISEWPEIECKMLEMFQKKMTAGIPEFGSRFVREYLLNTITPSDFDQAVRICGLAHGVDVWIGNAQTLINEQQYNIKDVISVKEDLYNILIRQGIDRNTAINIMHEVSRGEGLSENRCSYLKEYDVPEYFIDSCRKIKYLFPYAHAAEYCYIAFCLNWFKCYDMRKYFELWQMHHDVHIKEVEKTSGRKYPEMITDLRAEEKALLDELYENHPEEIMPFN